MVKALVNGPLEAKQIAAALGMTYAGTFSECLKDLVTSGFVLQGYAWHVKSGKVSKFSRFRLSDNYVRFYLKYVDSVLPKIENQTFELSSLSPLRRWETIMGYQFENLVLKNR